MRQPHESQFFSVNQTRDKTEKFQKWRKPRHQRGELIPDTERQNFSAEAEATCHLPHL